MRSKRKRKQKDLGSLRAKSGAQSTIVDTNACILPNAPEPSSAADHAEVDSDGGDKDFKKNKKVLSKSQQRKLRKIEEEKQKRAQRQEVLSRLAEHQLGDDALRIMRSVASRGQSESKKDMLKRALYMERAGIDVPEEMKLYSGVASEEPESVAEGAGAVDRRIADHPESHKRNTFAPKIVEKEEEEEEEAPSSSSEEEGDVVGGNVHQDPLTVREMVEDAKKEIELLRKNDDTDEEDQQRPGGHVEGSKNIQRRVVMVERDPAIEEARSSLPIIGMEQEIMESVSYNDVLVLCGETGCGKTTQVPQFLYEAGYSFVNDGIIGVTQPRRVAAVSTATRVAAELGEKIGGVVGYHVRYDRRIGDATKLQFMTDGILLREVQDDFLLKKYNVLVIDEAHERSLNTDILLGMLSRVVKLRRKMFEESGEEHGVVPLKLIIMSATLRIADFVENKKLFSDPPPVINVDARQYPVAVHFQKRTEIDDYVGAAFKKTCQIHRNLPDGGILVFLTGQREVETLCSKLRKTFDKKKSEQVEDKKNIVEQTDDILDGIDAGEVSWEDDDEVLDSQDDYEGISEEEEEEEEEDVVVLNGGSDGDVEDALKLEKDPAEGRAQRVWVLPLYAMLKSEQQAQVFKGAPEGHRLIVVATNIAETSLTIPGIRYVVDAGRSKQRLVEASSGIAKYEVRWISKASADQRAGRSGRLGPGHCYRLFSSAVYNDMFPQFSPPEIYNVALEGVVLLLKSIGVENVPNFPFPSPPDMDSLGAAQKCLVSLSALDKSSGSLTDIGMAMAQLPISPRHSRMLLEVLQNADSTEGHDTAVHALIKFAIRLTAAMSLESPFINASSLQDHTDEDGNKDSDKEERKQKAQNLYVAHSKLRVPESDALSVMNTLCAFEDSGGSSAFCRDNFLIFKHLREGMQLTKQLERIISGSSVQLLQMRDLVKTKRPKLTQSIVIALQKAIIAGWSDRVAKRVRSSQYLKKKMEAGSRTRAVRYESIALDEDVFLHPNSSLHSTSPEWIVYSDIIKTEKRAYMVGLTAIDPTWIYHAAAALCSVSKPLSDPSPKYVYKADCVMAWHDVSYGPLQWPLPKLPLPHPESKERAAIFGMAILDGTVVPPMKQLASHLSASPSIMAMPEMRVHRRLFDFIKALESRHVYTRHDLKSAWESDQSYLKHEISSWVKKPSLQIFEKLWPAIVSSVS
ncbi:hypothetical protein M9434_005859 [Picochlorum sp. BPE23]|nr:hypothetical protein M9434_005859 [Picochlorum sp. BPE23]